MNNRPGVARHTSFRTSSELNSPTKNLNSFGHSSFNAGDRPLASSFGPLTSPTTTQSSSETSPKGKRPSNLDRLRSRSFSTGDQRLVSSACSPKSSSKVKVGFRDAPSPTKERKSPRIDRRKSTGSGTPSSPRKSPLKSCLKNSSPTSKLRNGISSLVDKMRNKTLLTEKQQAKPAEKAEKTKKMESDQQEERATENETGKDEQSKKKDKKSKKDATTDKSKQQKVKADESKAEDDEKIKAAKEQKKKAKKEEKKKKKKEEKKKAKKEEKKTKRKEEKKKEKKEEKKAKTGMEDEDQSMSWGKNSKSNGKEQTKVEKDRSKSNSEVGKLYVKKNGLKEKLCLHKGTGLRSNKLNGSRETKKGEHRRDESAVIIQAAARRRIATVNTNLKRLSHKAKNIPKETEKHIRKIKADLEEKKREYKRNADAQRLKWDLKAGENKLDECQETVNRLKAENSKIREANVKLQQNCRNLRINNERLKSNTTSNTDYLERLQIHHKRSQAENQKLQKVHDEQWKKVQEATEELDEKILDGKKENCMRLAYERYLGKILQLVDQSKDAALVKHVFELTEMLDGYKRPWDPESLDPSEIPKARPSRFENDEFISDSDDDLLLPPRSHPPMYSDDSESGSEESIEIMPNPDESSMTDSSDDIADAQSRQGRSFSSLGRSASLTGSSSPRRSPSSMSKSMSAIGRATDRSMSALSRSMPSIQQESSRSRGDCSSSESDTEESSESEDDSGASSVATDSDDDESESSEERSTDDSSSGVETDSDCDSDSDSDSD